ncbi:MAG: hypothetical protein Q9160_007516 [Pyrenula sp. 1 TL-2023]
MQAATQRGGPAAIEIPDWPSDLTIVGSDNLAAIVAQYLPKTPFASMVFAASYAFLAITGLEIYLQTAKTSLPSPGLENRAIVSKAVQNRAQLRLSNLRAQAQVRRVALPVTMHLYATTHKSAMARNQRLVKQSPRGKYKSCTCIPSGTPFPHPVDIGLLSIQDAILAQITAGPPRPTPTPTSSSSNTKPTQTPVLTCNFDFCPAPNLYAGLPREAVLDAAKKFCAHPSKPSPEVKNVLAQCSTNLSARGVLKRNLAIVAKLKEGCHASGKSAIVKEKCVAAMGHAIDGCESIFVFICPLFSPRTGPP